MALCQGVETGIDLKKLIEAGRRLEDLMGHRGDSYVLRAGTNQEIRLNMPAGQLENQTLKHDTSSACSAWMDAKSACPSGCFEIRNRS